MLHGVQAQRHVLFGQVLVEVDGGAAQLIGAQGQAAGGEGFLLRHFADQVDGAAGGTAPRVGRARALDDLDLLDVEGFVGHAPDIATVSYTHLTLSTKA